MADVQKHSWGHELTIARTNDYCTKILAFDIALDEQVDR